MKRLFIATCLALAVGLEAVAAAAPSSGAKPFPVKATAPEHVTVKSFVNRSFKQTVTCTMACRVTTRVVIPWAVAKRLGFTHRAGKYALIATSKGSAKAKRPTRLGFVITSEARKLLLRARSPVRIVGVVRGVPKKRPGVNYSLAWSSTLG